MKRLISFLLVLTLIFGITGCTQNSNVSENQTPAESGEKAAKFTPGKYKASAMGMSRRFDCRS